MKIQNLTPINSPLINRTFYKRNIDFAKPPSVNGREIELAPVPFTYYPLTGINFKSLTTPQFLNELRGVKNVHCPTCGIKMLNHEEFKSLVEEISLIKTADECFEFINKYRDSINPIFDKVIKSVQKYVNQTPEEPIDNILSMVRGHYIQNYKQRAKAIEEDFKSLETFSAESIGYKEGILPLVNSKKQLSFNDLKDCLYKIMKSIPAESRPIYYKKYLELIHKQVLRINAFNKSEENLTYTQNFCKNLIKLSSSKTKTLFTNETSTEENTVLSCKYCTDIFKQKPSAIKESKELYFQYLYDIAEQILEGQLPSFRNYPVLLMNKVEKNLRITANQGHPSLRKLTKELDIKTGKFTQFPLINYEGIHCAYCGSETLTHDSKLDIFEQILATKNLAELSEVVSENARFIKERNAYIVDILAKAAQKDPNYDCNELLKDIQKYVFESIRKTMTESFKEIKLITNNGLSANDKKELANVKKAMFEDFGLLKSYKNPLNQYEYKQKLIEITNRMENPELKKLVWSELMSNIMDLYLAHRVLYPNTDLLKKIDNPFKIIIQDMIKDSSLTVDHLDSKGKYKETPELYQKVANDINNMVISCKSCNKEKSDSKVVHWVQKHPEIVLNFQQYLAKIKKLKADDIDNTLIDYDINEVAKRFSTITKIKLNLIEYFMKD